MFLSFLIEKKKLIMYIYGLVNDVMFMILKILNNYEYIK